MPVGLIDRYIFIVDQVMARHYPAYNPLAPVPVLLPLEVVEEKLLTLAAAA